MESVEHQDPGLESCLTVDVDKGQRGIAHISFSSCESFIEHRLMLDLAC